MHVSRRVASMLALIGLVGASACSGGGGGAGVVPQAAAGTPQPGVLATSAPGATTAPSAGPTSPPVLTVPSSAPSTSPSSRSFTLNLIVPKSIAAANGASYVSPATRSVRITPIVRSGSSVARAAQAAATPLVYPVGAGNDTCAENAAAFICSIPITLASLSNLTLLIQTYASGDGTGATPLSSATIPFSGGQIGAPPSWSPVVASVSASLSGPFSAGVASVATLSVTVKDAAGNPIPAGTTQFVDAGGSPVTIGLKNADASGMTTLSATTYAGAPVTLAYDGDLPLPQNLSVTVATSGGAAPTVSATATLPQPTLSKNFTFSLGSNVTTVQNAASIPLSPDYWNQTPDAKNAVVNLGDGKYLLSWSNGRSYLSASSSPYFENAPAGVPAYVGYAAAQPWESNGVWFRDILQQGNPYKPADPMKLVAFYHAESGANGPSAIYYRFTGRSTSTDGGKTWSPGQMILAPYRYPNNAPGTSLNAGDSGAAYDPVNKRWIEFYAGVDASSGSISGSMSEAISSDPTGAPGTWKKWYNGSFSEPGLGGRQTPIAAFANGYYSAADVSWNSYLNEWIMLLDAPDGTIALSTSPDLYVWTAPQLVMNGSDLGYTGITLVAYPTLVGPNDDKVTGRTSHLYFAAYSTTDPRIYGRVMVERTLTFNRND